MTEDNESSFNANSHPDTGDMHDVSSFPPKELGGVKMGRVIDSADIFDPGHAYEETLKQKEIPQSTT